MTTKRLFIIGTLLLLFLGGCGGGSDKKDETSEKFLVFDTSELKISYPRGWQVLTQKEFTSEIPEQTIVAFRDNVRNPLFTANVATIKNILSQPVSSLDYAKRLLQSHASQLKNYRELNREELPVPAGDKTFPSLFVIFEGKEAEEAELKKFVQISVVKGNVAYVVTGAIHASDDELLFETLKEMLRSFKVK